MSAPAVVVTMVATGIDKSAPIPTPKATFLALLCNPLRTFINLFPSVGWVRLCNCISQDVDGLGNHPKLITSPLRSLLRARGAGARAKGPFRDLHFYLGQTPRNHHVTWWGDESRKAFPSTDHPTGGIRAAGQHGEDAVCLWEGEVEDDLLRRAGEKVDVDAHQQRVPFFTVDHGRFPRGQRQVADEVRQVRGDDAHVFAVRGAEPGVGTGDEGRLPGWGVVGQ